MIRIGNKRLAVAAILIAAALVLTLVRNYTGYTASVDAMGGHIAALDIIHQQQTVRWHGWYGLQLMDSSFNDLQTATASPGGLELEHLIFQCLQPNIDHELYASTVDLTNVNFDNATAATIEQ